MDNLAAFVAQPLDRIQNEYYAGKIKQKQDYYEFNSIYSGYLDCEYIWRIM